MSEFYTQYWYKGKNYNPYLQTKEISKIIRNHLKVIYPNYKFSVTKEEFTWGSAINIILVSANFNPFVCNEKHECYQVNQYRIIDDECLTEGAKKMFDEINKFVKSYHIDDSDPMIDYFHTNFYYSLNIWEYGKPFALKP